LVALPSVTVRVAVSAVVVLDVPVNVTVTLQVVDEPVSSMPKQLSSVMAKAEAFVPLRVALRRPVVLAPLPPYVMPNTCWLVVVVVGLTVRLVEPVPVNVIGPWLPPGEAVTVTVVDSAPAEAGEKSTIMVHDSLLLLLVPSDT
jgi:hypothetical protein